MVLRAYLCGSALDTLNIVYDCLDYGGYTLALNRSRYCKVILQLYAFILSNYKF